MIEDKPNEQESGADGESAAEVLEQSDSIEQRARSLTFSSFSGFLAFGFGSGLLTTAPGTMGTFAAVPIAVLMAVLGLNGILFVAITFFAGIAICSKVTKRLEVEDYGGIVWDEMVGYWLVVAFLPLQWGWYLGAFVLFRAFDILKPWPISLVEESMEGGLGIMLDDVLAAIYSLMILLFIEMMMT